MGGHKSVKSTRTSTSKLQQKSISKKKAHQANQTKNKQTISIEKAHQASQKQTSKPSALKKAHQANKKQASHQQKKHIKQIPPKNKPPTKGKQRTNMPRPKQKTGKGQVFRAPKNSTSHKKRSSNSGGGGGGGGKE